MNPLPLRERIVGVLRLSPMPIDRVALCLSIRDRTAQRALARLERLGQVRRRGWERRKHGTAHLFEVAA